ncbi:MAG: helix-turn-helix transcriptional regulator [Faecousia sp.]
MNENFLSENIIRYRKAAGLTQEKLGKLLSVSMQAVSHWERGGAPDVALLPKLASALGVSIDDLFNYTSQKSPDISRLLRDEFVRTPEELRFSKANDLAWELFKSAIGAYDNQGDMLYQVANIHERINRKQYKDPSSVPTIISYDSDDGIMKASVAEDFQYTLIMPEPEDGYAALMKNEEEYLRLFRLLIKPYRLRALAYTHTRQQRSFSAALLASELGIGVAEAEEALTELGQHNLLMMSQLDTPDGPLNTYQLRPGCNLIPFLYFGAELMRSLGQYTLVFPARREPLFRGPLGENGLSPQWITAIPEEENQLPHGKYGMD